MVRCPSTITFSTSYIKSNYLYALMIVRFKILKYYICIQKLMHNVLALVGLKIIILHCFSVLMKGQVCSKFVTVLQFYQVLNKTKYLHQWSVPPDCLRAQVIWSRLGQSGSKDQRLVHYTHVHIL